MDIDTYAISSNSILDEGSKLSLVCIFIFFNKMPHIISDVFTEDMITVNGGIEFGSFLVVSREPLGGMRDIQTFYRLISKLFLTQSFETAQYDFMQTTQDTLPPSTAPFMAPKTRAPVDVLARPTSKQAWNAPGPSSTSSISKCSPSTLVHPSYIPSRLNFLRTCNYEMKMN